VANLRFFTFTWHKMTSREGKVMTSAFRLIMALVFLGPAAVSPARILSVNAEGSAEFPTIQAAVDQARDGDVVEIRPGAYRGPGNWDIEVRGKAITIRGVDPNDPDIVNDTVIDCNDPSQAGHQAFRLIGQTLEVTLAGVKITGGRGGLTGGGLECLGFVTVSRCRILNCSASRGGGVFCCGLWWEESSAEDGAAVRILDCRIERNTAHMGGGIYASSDGVLVKGCTLQGNRATSNGGGIAGDFTVADLENNSILGNRAEGDGGGIWLHETAATMADCWLAGNRAVRDGGALCVRNTSELGVPRITIRGSTVVGNLARGEGGGLFLQDLESDASPSIYGRVNSSILWQNQDRTGYSRAAQICGPAAATYSCIQGLDAHEPADNHNLAGDPLLVRWPSYAGDGWRDIPSTHDIDESRDSDFGDPHLQPLSPCIQAGDPAAPISPWAVDLDGQPRRMDKAVEIGVDEFCPSGIAILRPRGREILIGGTTGEVVWQSWNSPRRLRLEFSTDDGNHWETLDANAPSSGRLAWQVPGTVQSDVCLMRATPIPASSSLEVAYSDLFSIYPADFRAEIASKWRTGSADFQRTGRSRDAGPTVGCLRWRFDAGTAITCAPVVGLNGRIHLATYDGQVCTLDTDGRLIWACDIHDEVWGSPTVADDGTLYASSTSGRVYEIAPDGLLRRFYSVAPADDSAAILPNGMLALGSGILDLSLGGFFSFWAQSQTFTFASPALGADGTVYAVAWDMPGLYAFDPDFGARKWSFTSGSQGRSFAGPVVGENGLVYQTCMDDSHLYAIDARTGLLAWRTDLADPGTVPLDRRFLGVESWSEPVLGPDGTIYACLNDPFVRAIDPATGRIKRITRLGDERGFTMAVDSRGHVYAASADGCLYVVDAEGRLVSRFESDTPLSCPVIAAEGLLLVVGEKGTDLGEARDVLYAIAADPTGSVLRPPEDLQTSRDQRE
jgi:outer membrane protein assembly factor BamB